MFIAVYTSKKVACWKRPWNRYKQSVTSTIQRYSPPSSNQVSTKYRQGGGEGDEHRDSLISICERLSAVIGRFLVSVSLVVNVGDKACATIHDR